MTASPLRNAPMGDPLSRPAAVVIGRNEGARLIACLQALAGQASPVVYVDSGSTDDSVGAARRLGADVVQLDMGLPFTAARARNAGLARLDDLDAGPMVQLIDGDCRLEPGWIAHASAAMQRDPTLAVAAGRRREMAPDRTLWNLICDIEWNTPVGPTDAVGGDMLARRDALAEVGGFADDLIAGEEPEMCLRLRRQGWTIRRLDAPMTVHDAAMTRIGQWWRRMRRAGHAFAEVSWRHRGDPQAFWRRETRRAVLWGAVLPATVVAAAVLHPAGAVLALAYPVQVTRLAVRDRTARPHRGKRAALTMLGKTAEAMGAFEYHLRRMFGRRAGIIEYK